MVSRYFKNDTTSVFDDISSNQVGSSYPPESEIDEFPSASMPFQVERTCEAWIPSNRTKEILDSITDGSTRDMEDSELTLPGIGIKEDFDDPVKLVSLKYLSENVCSQRNFPTASSVTQDDRGLRQLIQAGCLHAAVNLTSRLLTVYGQGEGCVGQRSKHTRHSIRLWFIRTALLVKLRRFSFAELECQAFSNLDTPDLYLSFYPELYGGRSGSLVPFSFRLLLAEMPQFLGKHSEALDRLGKLLTVCEQILTNISKGFTEDGSQTMEGEFTEAALKIWKSRRVHIMLALTRCSVSLKDFVLCNHVIEKLLQENPPIDGLYSTLGRLSLYIGDIKSAQHAFRRHLENGCGRSTHDPVVGLLHSSYISSAKNDFKESVQILLQAHKINPSHPLVLNNLVVAMMYTGDLKGAVDTIEPAVYANPKKLLHEALVLNLCSLYELQSSEYQTKKLQLLALICQHKGDGFNVAALKLQ